MALDEHSLLRADHLGLLKARISGIFNFEVRKAIIHGNPDRVEIHANMLEEPKLIARKRGFVSYVGFLGNEPILITSSGMGAGSASIVIEELIELGIRKIIRVGTCGSYRKEIVPGDIVIPIDILIENSVLRYIFPDYLRERPIKTDINWLYQKEGFYFVRGFEKVYNKLLEAANKIISIFSTKRIHKIFAGPLHDKDILHAWREEYSLDKNKLLEIKDAIRKLTIATDMESGSLFTIAHLRGAEAGSILVVVDFFADEKATQAQDEGLELVYTISLKAIQEI